MKMKSEVIRIFGCLALMLVCGAAAVGETYTLAGDDSAGASSLTGGGAGWKDSSGTVRKLTPSAGNTYIVQGASDSSLRVLRTPPNVNSATVNGRLVLQHASLVFKLNHAGVLTVKDALVEGGMSRFRPGDIGYRYDVDGKFEIASDGKLQVESIFEGNPNANPPDRRTMKVLCELTGDGVLYVVRDGTDPRSNVSRALLGGDFSKFAGPVQIVNPLTETASVMSVDIMNANTFPGAMSPANSAGFVLDGGVLLNFLESGTIDFSRGVVFGPTANGKVPEINVAAGKEVTIESVVSGVQGFVKTGAGKLTIKKASADLSGTVTVREGTLAYAGFSNATVTTEAGGTTESLSETGVVASAIGYQGYEDDDVHGITVSVEEVPGVTYTYEWAADGGEFGPTEPKFQAAGEHTVSCRISAEGYDSATVGATVKIDLRTIRATMESEQIKLYDGTGLSMALTVSEPTTGANLVWTVDGGEPFEAAQLSITNPGVYSVVLQVSASHYTTTTLRGKLSVLYRGDLYADASGGPGIPPYDAPEKACADLLFLTTIASRGSTIHLASGTYEPADEISPAREMRFEGPADRSAVIRNKCLRMGVSGCFASGLTFEGGTDFALRITSGSVASNCCVRDVKSGVSMGGLLQDTTVTRFTATGVWAKGTTAKLERVAVTNGNIANVGGSTCLAPILVEESGTTLCLEDCDVSFNTNLQNNTSAGAIAVPLDDGGVILNINRCRFWRNSGRSGFCRVGASKQSGNKMFVTNSLIAECSSRAVKGSINTGVVPLCYVRGEFVNCTIADNAAIETPDTTFLFRCKNTAGEDCAPTVLLLKNCIVSGNLNLPTGPDGALPALTNSIYPECPAENANGNLPGPAVFKGCGSTPYALRLGSPGVGAGALLGWTKEDVDLAGHRRVTGGSVDMGCYQTAEGMAVLVR